MRAAQIGSDGILRDADGFSSYERRRIPVRPARRAPVAPSRPRPRQSLFGLGQAKPGSEVRQLVESKNYPLAHPAQEYQVVRQFVGDPQKQVCVGRVVFPSANIDSDSVYIVSARSAPKGFIRLMKIVGDQGHWTDYPLDASEGDPRSFRKDFMVASLEATSAVQMLFPIFEPVFEDDPEKKVDTNRATVSFARAIMIGAVDTMAAVPFTQTVAADVPARQQAAVELAASVVTAFTLFREAMESAAVGYDTHISGINTTFYLMKTAAQALKRLKTMAAYLGAIFRVEENIKAGKVAASAADKYYSTLGLALTDFLTQSQLWGAWLNRAALYANLTIWAAPQIEISYSLMAAKTYELIETVRSHKAEIAKVAELTEDQVVGAMAPFEDALRQGYIERAETGKEIDAALAKMGTSREEWDAGYSVIVGLLEENAEQIRRILKPPSIAPVLDPAMYEGLAGLGSGLGAVGVPRRIMDMQALFRRRILEEKVKIENIEDPTQRKNARDAFFNEFYKPIRQMAGEELASMVKWAETVDLKAIRENPALLETILSQASEGSPGSIAYTLGRKLVEGGVRAGDAIKDARTILDVKGKLYKLDQIAEGKKYMEGDIEIQRPADPYGALDQLIMLDFVTIYTERYASAKTGKQINAEKAALTFLKLVENNRLDTLTAADAFRLKVLEEERGVPEQYAASMGLVRIALDDKVKANKKAIEEGGKDTAGNRVELPNKKELESENARTERFLEVIERLDTGELDFEANARITDAMSKVDLQTLSEDRQKENIAILRRAFSSLGILHGMLISGKDAPVPAVIAYYRKLKEEGKLKAPKEGEERVAELSLLDSLERSLIEFEERYKELKSRKEGMVDLEKEIRFNAGEIAKEFKNYYDAGKNLQSFLRQLEARRAIRQRRENRWNKAKEIAEMVFFGPFMLSVKARRDYAKAKYMQAIYEFVFALGALVLWSVTWLYISRKVFGALRTVDPFFGGPRGLWDVLYNLTNKGWNSVWKLVDPGVDDVTKPSNVDRNQKDKAFSFWEIAGLALLVGTVVQPGIVIAGMTKLVGAVTRGVAVVAGKKVRGRPAGIVKKPGVGPGAPPNVGRAIEAIKKGRADGNPFLVKKGQDALRKAKAMGIPIPQGYIDGLFSRR